VSHVSPNSNGADILMFTKGSFERGIRRGAFPERKEKGSTCPAPSESRTPRRGGEEGSSNCRGLFFSGGWGRVKREKPGPGVLREAYNFSTPIRGSLTPMQNITPRKLSKPKRKPDERGQKNMLEKTTLAKRGLGRCQQEEPLIGVNGAESNSPRRSS